MAQHFDLTAAGADSFGLYRSLLSDLFDVTRRDGDTRAFQASVFAGRKDCLFAHSGEHQASRCHRDAAKLRRDGIDDICVIRIESGAIASEINGLRRRHLRGGVLFLDRSKPVRLILDDCRFSLVNAPRSLFAASHDGAGLHGRTLEGAHARGMIGRLAGMALEGDGTGSADANQEIASLGEALSEIALHGRASSHSERRSIIDRVAMAVDVHLADSDLSVDRLAHYAGVSRATLYRAFAGSDGCAAFVRRRRLEEAQRLLIAHPTRRISDIALDVGFDNFAHFSTAYRAAFGIAPRDTRIAEKRRLDAAQRLDRWRSIYRDATGSMSG